MPLLEVIALNPADARAAAEGGADRLELVSAMDADGLSPDLDTVAAVRAACDIELRVMLRARRDFAAAKLDELAAFARRCVDAGADGFVFGFLDAAGEMDRTAMRRLAEAVELPWTCHRAVDRARDYPAALAQVAALPGVDRILTAGSAAGLPAGIDAVCDNAHRAPLMAGGGLRLDQLPRLGSAGVEAFHIGSAARRDWNNPVEITRVARWRGRLNQL